MELLKPDMNEDNVTIDVLTERMDAFAERMLKLALYTTPLNFMVDNLAGFFSYIDGTEYGQGVLNVVGPLPFLDLAKSFPTTFMYTTQSDSAALYFEFAYVPGKGYKLEFGRTTAEGDIKASFSNKTSSIDSESRGIHFSVFSGTSDGRTSNTTIAYLADGWSKRDIQEQLEGYDGCAIRTSPYIALTLLDSFVNYVLNDRLLEKIEKNAAENAAENLQ